MFGWIRARQLALCADQRYYLQLQMNMEGTRWSRMEEVHGGGRGWFTYLVKIMWWNNGLGPIWLLFEAKFAASDVVPGFSYCREQVFIPISSSTPTSNNSTLVFIFSSRLVKYYCPHIMLHPIIEWLFPTIYTKKKKLINKKQIPKMVDSKSIYVLFIFTRFIFNLFFFYTKKINNSTWYQIFVWWEVIYICFPHLHICFPIYQFVYPTDLNF